MPTTATMLLPYPAATDPADVPTDMRELAERIETVRGAAAGLAALDVAAKVPVAQLPAGTPNGVASLGADGKIPVAQLPAGSGAFVLAARQIGAIIPGSGSQVVIQSKFWAAVPVCVPVMESAFDWTWRVGAPIVLAAGGGPTGTYQCNIYVKSVPLANIPDGTQIAFQVLWVGTPMVGQVPVVV